jgi:hypothetical protein
LLESANEFLRPEYQDKRQDAKSPPHSRSLRLTVLLAVSSAGMGPVRAEPPRFSVLASGIAHAIFEVRPADAEPFSGHAFKIDLDVAELRLVSAGNPLARRTVEQIVAPYPVVVAVNASFFDKEDPRWASLSTKDELWP